MVTELLWGLVGFGGGSALIAVGYALGHHAASRDADDDAASEELLHADDYERGYNAGLEAGRAATNPDPIALTTTATAVRDARLPWIHRQVADHNSSYRELFWRLIEVARDIGERYRKVESLGQAGLVPIGDALNLCVYVADIARNYDDYRVLALPHRGVWEGKAS